MSVRLPRLSLWLAFTQAGSFVGSPVAPGWSAAGLPFCRHRMRPVATAVGLQPLAKAGFPFRSAGRSRPEMLLVAVP
jgi:hypothetical protein